MQKIHAMAMIENGILLPPRVRNGYTKALRATPSRTRAVRSQRQ